MLTPCIDVVWNKRPFALEIPTNDRTKIIRKWHAFIGILRSQYDYIMGSMTFIFI